jgi:hypothetical protein
MQTVWRDLIPVIFSYLTARDLVAAADVCRFWRKHSDNLFAKKFKLPWTDLSPRVCYKWVCTNQNKLYLDRCDSKYTVLAMGFTFPTPDIQPNLLIDAPIGTIDLGRWKITQVLEINRYSFCTTSAETMQFVHFYEPGGYESRCYEISLWKIECIWQSVLDSTRPLTIRECLEIVFQPTQLLASDREFINRFLDGLP